MKRQYSSTKGIVPLQPVARLGKTSYELSRDSLDKLANRSYHTGVGAIRCVTLAPPRPFSPYATHWTCAIAYIDEMLAKHPDVFLESIRFDELKPIDIKVLRQRKDYLPYALQLGSCEITTAGFYKNCQPFSATARLKGARVHLDGTFTAKSGSYVSPVKWRSFLVR